LGGGDWLKFSDVVIATASIVLIGLILEAVLMVAFVPLNSNMMSDTLAFVIAFLVASLIVGYVFALKIQEESRTRAIGSIVVLSNFVLMLSIMVWFANPLASPWVKESIGSLFNTSGWTNYEWAAYSGLAVTIDIAFGLVLSFVGLYAGSMLRKPKKT
jgi:protein-S-isoprenylcysteine O-methyltransferase Ste14